MDITKRVAQRATCLRRKVGAILVKDKKILATGYNGAPAGLEHCEEAGCLRERFQIPQGERHELCRGTHGEQNAIIQAATFGVSINKATLYTTHFPCILCTKLIINAGIKRTGKLGPPSVHASLSSVPRPKAEVRAPHEVDP